MRREMTYRVVPLTSLEASVPPRGATVDERLKMVRELSIAAWTSTGRPFPRYTRSTMPVRVTRLCDQGGPADR
jgi:hypothetical protein